MIYNSSKLEIHQQPIDDTSHLSLSSKGNNSILFALVLARYTRCKGFDVLFKALNSLPLLFFS